VIVYEAKMFKRLERRILLVCFEKRDGKRI